MFAAYIDGLADIPLGDAIEACRRWPALPDRGKWWPALEELRAVADDIACERRMRDMPPIQAKASSPKPKPWRPMSTELKAEYRRLIGDMRAHPDRYVAAKTLVDWGEKILARDAERCRMEAAE